jgi:cytoskeletal protein RodZ
MTHCLHKSISLILTFLLLISLMGCSSSSKKETNDQKAKVTQAKNDKKQKNSTGENNTQVQAASTTNQQSAANTATQAVAAKSETNQQTVATKPNAPAQVTQPSKPAATTNTAASQPASSPAPAAPAPAAQAPVQTVKISITGPKDRPTILNGATINIKENETILDVLLDAAGKNNIDVDKTGSGATAYIRGIAGIYERDYGAMSGWICKQNGTGIAKSAGAITVKAGDQIEWIYKED